MMSTELSEEASLEIYRSILEGEDSLLAIDPASLQVHSRAVLAAHTILDVLTPRNTRPVRSSTIGAGYQVGGVTSRASSYSPRRSQAVSDFQVGTSTSRASSYSLSRFRADAGLDSDTVASTSRSSSHSVSRSRAETIARWRPYTASPMNATPEPTESRESNLEIAQKIFGKKIWEIAALNTRDGSKPHIKTKNRYETWYLVKNLVEEARKSKMMAFFATMCYSCHNSLKSPVTGTCGHTRCMSCIENNKRCPCGVFAREDLKIDILANNIITNYEKSCEESMGDDFTQRPKMFNLTFPESADNKNLMSHPVSENRKQSAISPRVCLTPELHLDFSLHFTLEKQLEVAVFHLARAACNLLPGNDDDRVTFLLENIIGKLLEEFDYKHIHEKMKNLLYQQSSPSWLRVSDFECTLCLATFTKPITTPCGHTFCRFCIERLIDYKMPCALCKTSLEKLYLPCTQEASIIVAALKSLEAHKAGKLESNEVYFMNFMMAFPRVACPLYVVNPKYWCIIRRAMESNRIFGMIYKCQVKKRQRNMYGTILEIRDCIEFGCGRMLVSTIGISRIEVLDTYMKNGCEVALYRPFIDAMPDENFDIPQMRNSSLITQYQSQKWLRKMSPEVRQSIIDLYGVVPLSFEDRFWLLPDGPTWLWWMITVIPLREEIKTLILSTNCLKKRMLVVVRTLEILQKRHLMTMEVKMFNGVDITQQF